MFLGFTPRGIFSLVCLTTALTAVGPSQFHPDVISAIEDNDGYRIAMASTLCSIMISNLITSILPSEEDESINDLQRITRRTPRFISVKRYQSEPYSDLEPSDRDTREFFQRMRKFGMLASSRTMAAVNTLRELSAFEKFKRQSSTTFHSFLGGETGSVHDEAVKLLFADPRSEVVDDTSLQYSETETDGLASNKQKILFSTDGQIRDDLPPNYYSDWLKNQIRLFRATMSCFQTFLTDAMGQNVVVTEIPGNINTQQRAGLVQGYRLGPCMVSTGASQDPDIEDKYITSAMELELNLYLKTISGDESILDQSLPIGRALGPSIKEVMDSVDTSENLLIDVARGLGLQKPGPSASMTRKVEKFEKEVNVAQKKSSRKSDTVKDMPNKVPAQRVTVPGSCPIRDQSWVSFSGLVQGLLFSATLLSFIYATNYVFQRVTTEFKMSNARSCDRSSPVAAVYILIYWNLMVVIAVLCAIAVKIFATLPIVTSK